ncbi:PHD-finger domain-containing protein [Colletotrichum orchidophilum]|uniref:Chromatin modification-related protein n=1 Tax=Colletotrichum orchidophilum TaxID=1209926 RepID=A0A1G4ANR4_9PEZI|nr:PHD-finger domain-containing protein [Colletotrichum orchidophilum]OHE90672.1 PHD-finger domain-containing protein [Colletotrichum orchidophilum]
MPRDDLSIDFVRRMPTAEALDPAIILDDWLNRVQNLPEEIRFLQDEIADRDRQYGDCVKLIEDRDGKIQKWIRANGSHETNPREQGMRSQMRDNFIRADQLATEKIALTQKLQIIMDKHLRNLDQHVKMLYDRAEPGFNEPDECPSLIRPSAANHSAPSSRSINPASHLVGTAITATPLNPIINSSSPVTARVGNPQIRNAQSQQHASSAPATPAASMIMNRQARESSAGPGSGAPKRGPRSVSGLGVLPATSSSLARHSSLGPGTPKGTTPGPNGAVRAGSAGPRSSSTKASSVSGIRKGTPGAAGRKKPISSNKSSLSRVKKAGSRNSPASTADSELSDAESGSGDDGDRSRVDRTSGTPAREGKDADADGDDSVLDAEDDEAGDDKKYCTCQNVSFGDMVACDNEDCPYEWFHWSCVGLKSEPNGTWYCPVCTENMEKQKKK